MDKVNFVLLIIIAVVLVGGMYFLSQKIDTLNTEVTNLKNSTANAVDVAETNTNSTNTKSEPTKSGDKKGKVKVEFDSDKVKVGEENGIYEVMNEDDISLDELGMTVDIEEGKAYVSVKFVKDYTDDIYGIDEEVEREEITGFDGEPVMCFMAETGQDITAPRLCFLMEDGTVEYVDSAKMLKSKKYVSEGKLGNLKDIVAFEYVSVADADMQETGHVSSVAIDKSGYAYDIYVVDN
ncbi:MAG: hypothetical protein K6D97_09000 [Clostridia bacterium]|nr:hypothetical protein [Clostridia bacterium]